MSEPASDSALPLGSVVSGDCLDTMARWPAASIDLIFADPPYNIGYQYDHYEDTRDDHEYVEWTFKWIDACTRLLRPTGSLYVLIGDEYAAETRVHLKELERQRRLVFRNWIVWHYTFGQNTRAKFNRSHAHLFYCVGPAAFESWAVSDPPFTFNKDAVAVPSARQMVYADRRANPTGKAPDDTWYLRPQDTDGHYFRDGEDTWYFSRLCGTFKERVGWHPCQLPESLLERIVKVSSHPGGVVFDPFTGSGTTLAVAARLGRKWIGCELSPGYAARAAERIAHAARTGGKLLSTQEDKGIERGKPKKKAEPYRSTFTAGARRK